MPIVAIKDGNFNLLTKKVLIAENYAYSQQIINAKSRITGVLSSSQAKIIVPKEACAATDKSIFPPIKISVIPTTSQFANKIIEDIDEVSLT